MTMNNQKQCKGCGQPINFYVRNNLKTYKQKHGFGMDCGCVNTYEFKKLQKNTMIKSIRPRIAPRSKKRQAQEKIYSQLRKAFLNKPENRICPITGEKATTVHHKMGRLGDLLTDTRYWIALSMKGHEFIEHNPEWAKKQGYSLSRLEK